jgi:hypothetical protein
MSETETRSFLTQFGAWLDQDAWNMERVAEYLIKRATGGHIGYFRLLLDLVDGKPGESGLDEPMVEAGTLIVVSEEGPGAGRVTRCRVAA